jgi:Transposase DDE domain
MTVIGQEQTRTKDKILGAAMHPVRLLLPTALIEDWCRALDYSWRERDLGPVVTLLACVWKHMQPKVVSARDVEDAIVEWSGDEPVGERSGSNFCQARQRLPKAVLQRAVEHVGGVATRACARMFHGWRVWYTDGSSVRVPNTDALDSHFGRSTDGRTRSKTPVARLLLLVCAGSLAVLNVLTGAYCESEQALFMQLLSELPGGGLILGDRAFGSYVQCCRVQVQGSHLLARLRANRKGKKVKQLGYRDELVEWQRPQPKDSAFPEWLAECPPRIYVRVIERTIRQRGYRPWTLRLVTTLIEPDLYPARELVELYMTRWNIETVLRTLKTHYGMERVSGKTPDVAEKEILSTVLAYNCVAALMSQSGEAPELISPTRARNIVLRHAQYMSHASTCKLPELFRRMLRLLAKALQLPQERLPQPRAILRHKNSYPLLRGSRADWRKKFLTA